MSIDEETYIFEAPSTYEIFRLRNTPDARLWVLISQSRNRVLVGLCSDGEFKYMPMGEFTRHYEKIDAAGTKGKIISAAALHYQAIRNIVYSKAEDLISTGTFPGRDTRDSETLAAIDAIYNGIRSSVQGQLPPLPNPEEVETQLRRALAASPRQRNVPGMLNRPSALPDGTQIIFTDPLQIITVNIKGKDVQLVTRRYIERLLREQNPVAQLTDEVMTRWLRTTKLQPINYQARLSSNDGKNICLCNAYELSEVTEAMTALPLLSSLPPQSEDPSLTDLPTIDSDGTLIIEHDGDEQIYQTIESFAKDHGVNKALLARILKRKIFEKQGKPAQGNSKANPKITVYPIALLSSIRSLFIEGINAKKFIHSSSFPDEIRATLPAVTTVSVSVPHGRQGTPVIEQEIRETLIPLTLTDLCLDIKDCTYIDRFDAKSDIYKIGPSTEDPLVIVGKSPPHILYFQIQDSRTEPAYRATEIDDIIAKHPLPQDEEEEEEKARRKRR